MAARVAVRATIKMRHLGLGQIALVDPDEPFIRLCLDRGYLVRVGKP